MDLSVLSTHARLRGIGRYVRDLARALEALGEVRRGFAIHGLTDVGRFWSSPRTQSNLSEAIRTIEAAGPAKPHSPWAGRMRRRLPRVSGRFHHGLLHLGNPDAAPFEPLAMPVVPTCHDLIPLRYPEEYLRKIGFERRRETEAARYHSARHVIAVSRTAADDLMRFLDLPASHITVVHNGLDLSRWSPTAADTDAAIRAGYGLEDAPYLLYVGAGDWRKNAQGMLRALSLARRQPGARALQLVWAGRLSREHARNLKTWTAELGLHDAVKALGYVPDASLEALYRGARATVLVSLAEGFGYPLVEAMACGCPVVTSRGTSTEEIADDAALTVDPLDVEAIAEAFSTLARGESERRRLAERGRTRARRFGLERMAEGTAAVFRDVLGA